MGFQCMECGYIGYKVCKNCHKTAGNCKCGEWMGMCPKCEGPVD